MEDFIIFMSELVYHGFTYDLFMFVGFMALLFFYLWRGKVFGISVAKSLLLVFTVYPVAYAWMFIACWIENGFQGFGANNVVRAFVYFPLIAVPVSKMLKMDWKKACDLLAPAPCLAQGVSHWGCTFYGCCHGFEVDWGIYNPQTGTYCFPNPPLEALTALIIVGILLYREKKRNYTIDGLAMPLMLMLFGTTRFLWEFCRDNEKIWLGCSSLAFHALFMAVVGMSMYIIIRRKNNLATENEGLQNKERKRGAL